MIDFTSSIIIEKLCNFYTDNITHLSLNGKQALGETKNKGMLLVRTGADAIIHTGRGGGGLKRFKQLRRIQSVGCQYQRLCGMLP